MKHRLSHRRAREVVLEQDECCAKGHRPSLLLRTESGGRVCLLCVSTLVSDRDALIIHRTYAAEELSMVLTDRLFASALFNSHPKFFVASLSDAIGSSMDEKFSEAVMVVILSLCRLSREAEESLVEDFTRKFLRQLECPSLWHPSKCFTLRLIGLLLELHYQQELCLPQTIRNQKNFVPNLIVGLQLPGEPFQEEIFYVLFKLASLDDGVEQFLHHSPRLCHAAIQALLKMESNSLIINCIALLNVMARRLIFNISLRFDSAPGRDENLHASRESVADSDSSFAKTFAEAMKGPLLSPDHQVQASALQLICSVFPEGVRLDDELQIFVEGGIVDYVFEIIRLSGSHEDIQGLAVDVLILLSAEEHVFPQRFKFGIDAVIQVLEQSMDAHSKKLQTNILYLLCRSLSFITETLSTPRAEHLMLLLTKIIQDLATAVEDPALIGETSILPPLFNLTCLALVSLTQAPGCAGIPNVHRILRTATASTIIAASSTAKFNPDPSSLTSSACLLQEVYKFNKRQIVEDDTADSTMEALIGVCELHLLPAFTDNLDKLFDERLILTFLQTFTLVLKTEVLESTHRFALKLTSNRCFTLAFELMSQFPAREFKESAYRFLSALVGKLAGCSLEAYIDQSIELLPSDPTDLLKLLEQRIVENQLLSAHHASIAILSTSFFLNDRLAMETDIVASLEQHLLINQGAALAPEAILRQFVSLYASAKDAFQGLDAAWSGEAEKVLELVIGRSDCSGLLCSKTPKPVLKWFLRKEALKATRVQILAWFSAVQNKCFGELPPDKNSKEETRSQSLATLTELIESEDCGTSTLTFLFDTLVVQGVDDDIRIVSQTFTQLARMSVLVGHQLVQHGLISTLHQLIRTNSSKPTDSTMTSCLELLFQLLYDSDRSNDVMNNRSWLDIAHQCARLVLRKKSSDTTFEVVAPLSLINLILHKAYENNFFTQACEDIVYNRDLCAKLEAPILHASSQGAKLSHMDSKSAEAQLLSAAAIFCLLRLRCAFRFEHQMGNLANEKQHMSLKKSGNAYGGATGSKISRTSLTHAHWCRILYFGSPPLKTLACYSIAEIFSQLPGISKSTVSDSMTTAECGMSVSFFTVITMILQGSILGDCERIQKVASCCLSTLLRSNGLSVQQKRSVSSSPWNHMLLENLVLSLSSTNFKQYPGPMRSQASFSAAYVALGLLKTSPPQLCLSSIFSHSSITSIISNLCEADISPIIISFFHELLLSRYLTNEHVQILRDLFQSKRKTYGRGVSLRLGDSQSNSKRICSKIFYVDHSTDHIIHSAILELALTSSDEALDTFGENGEDSGTSRCDSGSFTSLLDAFMLDSYIQFD